MGLSFEDGASNCQFRPRQSELESYFSDSKRSVSRIYAYYCFAVCVAAVTFVVPITDQYSKFGAMLIFFPTIVTGIHVFLLSRLSGQLSNILSDSGRGTSCDLCEAVYEAATDAITKTTQKLHLVIIIETVLASMGTFVWAFGDCISPRACLV